MSAPRTLVCTFDLEPWWTIVPPVVSRDAWDRLPDRSERPLHTFLDLCDETDTTSTFFVVGEYGRRFPTRIRLIADRGHEVGCHSLFHDDLATQPLPQFREETRVAKDVLEQASGKAVQTFRAPSFSIPERGFRDFFSVLQDLAFTIDSSLSSATRVYGTASNLGDVGRVFSLKDLTGTDLMEVGVPGVPLLGREWTIFGGGYLRMTPTCIAKMALQRAPHHVLYLHAHDFDRERPRVPGSTLTQYLRQTLRIGDLLSRVRTLLELRRGITCEEAVSLATSPTPVARNT